MDMSILNVALPGAAPATGGDSAAGKVLDGFGSALSNAVTSLDRLQHEADQKAIALATGDPVELHDVMIAQDQASLGLQLAVQVRNKMVEAYQDIMRMQL
jgi:flagellar hook-basal body complex protein FliE